MRDRRPLLIESGVVGWAEKFWKQGELEASLEIVSVIVSSPAKDRLTGARAVRLHTAIVAEARAASHDMNDLVEAILRREPNPDPV